MFACMHYEEKKPARSLLTKCTCAFNLSFMTNQNIKPNKMVKALRYSGLSEADIAKALDINQSSVNRIQNQTGEFKGVNIGVRLALLYLEKHDVLPDDKVSVCTNTNAGNTE